MVMVEVGGRQLRLSNLAKVLYPKVGFTKSELIDYYARIAPTMIDHIAGRCITMRRWPNGVEADSFFNKRCPEHRPEWLAVAPGPSRGGDSVKYCCIDEVAALVWAANLASIELHGPMARCDDLDTPTMLVFDLDPGAPATIIECCQVALEIRQVLGTLGLEVYPKTSGGKGLQLYLPLNSPHSHQQAANFALAVGQLLARRNPERVVVDMAKALRVGKVLVDWSQNSRHKTTIAPYSLRAGAEPTVSTPLGWDEVQSAANASSDAAPLRFGPGEVLERVEERGDLFAPTIEQIQHLPRV